MGQEIECKIRYQERTLSGMAHLETDHMAFRGQERIKIIFKDLTRIQAEGGILRLEFTGGPAELELGSLAEKWARKIQNPPSVLQKLGVKPGLAVRLVGPLPDEFRADLNNCRVEAPGELDPADLIFLSAERAFHLRELPKLVPGMKPDGALWVVYPKGVTVIREADVIKAGRDAQLKDVKVASLSLTHTGLKFVIPKLRR